ncbi:MAG: hypothetical protein ABSG94_05880 [Brevinematales bacterium]|jgi:hypothetical protein
MLITIEEAGRKINNGEVMMIAGDQDVLGRLPRGTWIGGSIPYFIAENGGLFSKDKVFVTDIDKSRFVNTKIISYTQDSISGIAKDIAENGLAFLILPFGSPVHIEYAKKSPGYEKMFLNPIIGWISGIALDEIGKKKATVMNGITGEVYTDRGIALNCTVLDGKVPQIGIINIFSPGSGDSIEFDEEGFDIKDCRVNGSRTNLAEYIQKNNIDTKLPLVGNFSGAMVNASFQSIDKNAGIVHLYAPVFKNMVYKIAAPVGDYIMAFEKALMNLGDKKILFSCNCILNYIYAELEGKKTGNATGPITFGEIAYQLLNQTFVYIEG